MHACIFNIQKFSIHDGPGIRTTVFFKGCPLRCAWCSNPESLASEPQMLWAEKLCVRCGVCESVCREKAITLSNDAVVVNHSQCARCGKCAEACPSRALTMSGKRYTLAEVTSVCLQDKDFYEDSGGGVTLSGGEVTMQHRFAALLLSELRTHGIHTALETNGFAREEIFRGMAESADMLLFDVKHYDTAKHQAGTGVSNALILANLRWTIEAGKEVLVRIPVIRGFNSSLDDARKFARLMLSMGVKSTQLLPFHQMGENKYVSLGMEYALRSLPPLHKEDLEDYRCVMQGTGLEEVIL